MNRYMQDQVSEYEKKSFSQEQPSDQLVHQLPLYVSNL